ncbi:MAG: homoserine dehydrogenase [Amphiplicatus sp.]
MNGKSKDRKQVVLAGFGVVGQGVYARIAHSPDFEIVGVVRRNIACPSNAELPADLVTDRFEALPDFDILVEVIGGIWPAEEFVLSALRRGADVVSANKTLIARRFDLLHREAALTGARLLFSAAVGGGVPMLEAVEAAAAKGAIARIDAVLNGTTNFVLDRIGAGLDLEEALTLAREAGFAEADPSADINGEDAADKIALLVRRGFGEAVNPESLAKDPLTSISPADIAAAAEAGTPYKQVASAWRTETGVAAEVRLKRVRAGEPLAEPQLEENCLVITPARGAPVVLHGRGAGREPTTDSVMSDLAALLACEPSS